MKIQDKKPIHEASILQHSPMIRKQSIVHALCVRPNQNNWKWPPGRLNRSGNISGEGPDPQQSLTK